MWLVQKFKPVRFENVRFQPDAPANPVSTEPYKHSKEPYTHFKETHIHSKEPHIHFEEHCTHSKEPYSHSKEHYITNQFWRSWIACPATATPPVHPLVAAATWAATVAAAVAATKAAAVKVAATQAATQQAATQEVVAEAAAAAGAAVIQVYSLMLPIFTYATYIHICCISCDTRILRRLLLLQGRL